MVEIVCLSYQHIQFGNAAVDAGKQYLGISGFINPDLLLGILHLLFRTRQVQPCLLSVSFYLDFHPITSTFGRILRSFRNS